MGEIKVSFMATSPASMTGQCFIDLPMWPASMATTNSLWALPSKQNLNSHTSFYFSDNLMNILMNLWVLWRKTNAADTVSNVVDNHPSKSCGSPLWQKKKKKVKSFGHSQLRTLPFLPYTSNYPSRTRLVTPYFVGWGNEKLSSVEQCFRIDKLRIHHYNIVKQMSFQSSHLASL